MQVSYNTIQTAPAAQFFSSIENLMSKAHAENDLQSKRKLYNDVFISLGRPSSLSQSAEFINLLLAYAKETCYAQTFDNNGESGFIKSARLMEYILCQLFSPMDIPSVSIEDFLKYLEQNSLFTKWNELNVEPDMLYRIAQNLKLESQIKEALIRLAYSYQNISSLNVTSSKNIEIHTKLNEFVAKFLSEKEAVEFAYNREPFIILLIDPLAKQERIHCYLNLVDRFKKVLPELEAKGKEAQIYNMLGLTSLRENFSNETALGFFRQAQVARNKCLINASEEKKSEEEFLYANLLTGLITCLCRARNQNEATPYVQWLYAFNEELKLRNNTHSYMASYENALKLYDITFQSA